MKAILAAMVCVAAVQVLPAQTAQAPQQVAAALQKKYDSIRDFTAEFTHLYEGGVLRKKAAERGDVLIKKPGRMRWNYTTPEKKTFISDGIKIYMHIPADKQVMVSDVPREDQATSAVMFLLGKGNLTRDFSAEFGKGGTDSAHVLRLTPKVRQADYDWLEVTVDKATMQILGLKAGDGQGGTSTFRFTNIKENVGLADKTFAFSIPRGTEVIQSGSSR
jgi:outer membrane lipoprotein carrier protein